MSSPVVVAMSGGVDSSIAAALLCQQGFDVIGIMLHLWCDGAESENRCCTSASIEFARNVSERFDFTFHFVDASDQFRQHVVEYFLDGCSQCVTPTPCIICNRFIRWGFLLDRAKELGASHLATGHYARVQRTSQGRYRLLRGLDPNKDQSYFLSMLNQDQLAHTLFPLGDLSKVEVREIARSFDLSVAERKDSQDLCFLGNGDYRSFIARNIPDAIRHGQIINQEGDVLGEHQSLAFYTIGQRKGLGLSMREPHYVLRKDLGKNVLVVGPEDELGQEELVADGMSWISGEAPSNRFRAQAKTRYRASAAWGTVSPLGVRRIHIQFDQPLRDITPGQAVVLYDGDVTLGGGMIQNITAKESEEFDL